MLSNSLLFIAPFWNWVLRLAGLVESNFLSQQDVSFLASTA